MSSVKFRSLKTRFPIKKYYLGLIKQIKNNYNLWLAVKNKFGPLRFP